jgi:putative CocE/NonD family hydrolase
VPDRIDAVAERREVDCVLRDGIRLRTVLLLPRGDGPWPALLTRHPYDVTGDEDGGRVDVHRLVAAGYLVALQDVRGRYASEGVFEPSAREADDGADAVAWLAALPECTGVVGMFGASYASETQFSALLGGAPALRSIVPAVTPVASGLDGFRFRGGVPEIGSMTAWSHFAIAPGVIDRIADPAERDAQRRRWEATDRAIASGEAFAVGALADPEPAEQTVQWMRERLRLPLEHPDHLVGKIGDRLDALSVPALIVGGWFDVFLGSTLEVHRRLAERAAANHGPVPHLLVGPWSHDNMTGRIGGVDFGATASAEDLGGDDLTARHLDWFDATLRAGRASDDRAPVQVFLMGADRWVELPSFPPPGARPLLLHLAGDGRLTAEPEDDGVRLVPVDPHDPVPTRGGATLLFPPYEPGPLDQAELERRADVVAWSTEPLEAQVTVIGAVRAIIHLATTGTDADLVVRLCDVDAEGRSRLVADGVRRASTRDLDPVTGRGTPRPLEPGITVELAVDLWSTAHVFLPGHRIRVDVAPSSSPRWAVNPGRFATGAEAVEPERTEHTIRFGAGHPSRLVLTVVPDPPATGTPRPPLRVD